jgi:hypothetical protein
LSWDVGNQPPTYAAKQPRRAKASVYTATQARILTMYIIIHRSALHVQDIYHLLNMFLVPAKYKIYKTSYQIRMRNF